MRIRTVFAGLSIALGCTSASGAASAQNEIRSHRFLTTDGVELHYLEAGSGPTIVFVPGFSFPAEVWEPQLAHFAGTHRVVALDPRSQGRSEKPADGHHLARRGEDIGDLIQHLDAGPVVVVGWSLAVREILTYADTHGTDLFRGIVLVDMTLGVDEPLGEPHPSEPGWRRWMAGLQLDRQEFTRVWVRGMYESEKPEEYLEAMTKAVLAIPTNSAVTLLANLMLMEERDQRPVVDHLDRPVLIVTCAQRWAKALAEEARQRWPHIRVETLEKTGHALFVDRPERFNQVLEEFLATLPKRRVLARRRGMSDLQADRLPMP
jgi:microsomal epoxide hydrolase